MTAGASAGKNQVRPASQGSVRMPECDFQSQLRAPLKAVGTYHYVHTDGAPPLKRELAMFVYVRAITTFFYWLSSKIATLPFSLSRQCWQGGWQCWAPRQSRKGATRDPKGRFYSRSKPSP